MSYRHVLQAIQVYVLSGSDTGWLNTCDESIWGGCSFGGKLAMGCKAEGAAQGFTVLGGLVLLIFAIERIYRAMMSPGPGSLDGVIEILLGIVIIIMVALAFDACGFISWKVQKSGALLSLFGLIIILIVSYPAITLDPIAWFRSLYTLAGLMILLGGLLLIFKK